MHGCMEHWSMMANKKSTRNKLPIWPLLLLLFFLAYFIYFSNHATITSFTFCFPGTPQHNTDTTSDHALTKQGTMHEMMTTCDLYNGTWVRDFGGTIYTNMTCKTLPDNNKCEKYGKDHDFVKWRWKPHGCHLPRFDPEHFLHTLRGMNLAFVGDSVARNHKDSLLCMLSQVESPQNTYNDEENQITKWYFETYNFTLTHLWTTFLVRSEERKFNGSPSETHVFLDQVDPNWASHLHQVNYVVLSGGHWFFRQLYLYLNNKLIGSTLSSDKDKDIPNLYQTVFRTTLNYLRNSAGTNLQLVVVRTFSPSHFEGGAWNGGGSCNRTTPNLDPGRLRGTHLEVRNAQVGEIERVRNRNEGGRVRFAAMDVTWVMEMRPDGHPGSHWDNKWNRGYSDCVHWCMPGAVDTWNEFLFEILKNVT